MFVWPAATENTCRKSRACETCFSDGQPLKVKLGSGRCGDWVWSYCCQGVRRPGCIWRPSNTWNQPFAAPKRKPLVEEPFENQDTFDKPRFSANWILEVGAARDVLIWFVAVWKFGCVVHVKFAWMLCGWLAQIMIDFIGFHFSLLVRSHCGVHVLFDCNNVKNQLVCPPPHQQLGLIDWRSYHWSLGLTKRHAQSDKLTDLINSMHSKSLKSRVNEFIPSCSKYIGKVPNTLQGLCNMYLFEINNPECNWMDETPPRVERVEHTWFSTLGKDSNRVREESKREDKTDETGKTLETHTQTL